MRDKLRDRLAEIEHHLTEELLPYWRMRGDDPEYGGFLTCFDPAGKPTGESDKNLLANCRLVFSFSLIAREGLDHDGSFLRRATEGAQWVLDHFTDREHGGYYWIVERDGTPLNPRKIIYGHSFVVYAFSELAMATGEDRWLAAAVETFELLQNKAADQTDGGYWEFFERNWDHSPPGPGGGDRKSLDVHMHLMEAFTNLYAAAGDPVHATRTRELIGLLTERMLHPEHGTGIAQFDRSFNPLRAILFDNVWGSDRDMEDSSGRPLDNTSYGHNVELGWLLRWSLGVLGEVLGGYRRKILRLYDHCLRFGIDRQLGGVFCEGPNAGAARERNKEFWQQAETMVAMLDGYEITGDQRYLEGYDNVHRFVFDRMINHALGEWLPLFDEHNNVIWDYMGHRWKINYHTVRGMIECRRRLNTLLSEDSSA
ncbi:MAG: N-acylglucosamine 2-epimerase [Candidatus Glassbacteria bacterium]|nr:N-acylglucosamine 2-epimerase [Candidatus Glassbacteria bacterium]